MASRRTARSKRPRLAGWQKAAALVPLVLLAGAWSANLGTSPTATADSAGSDPDVPAVPTTSFDQPASYTKPAETTFRSVSSNGDQPPLDQPHDPSSVSSNSIPTAAMAAYRSAETVMAQADPACHLSWALVAAIGRVESDHGRFGGSVLNADGVATPGIYGLPLDGSHDTAMISDSDGGAYDHDRVFDRAVGPMQFIPGTWDIVGVDADGDGQRNPQDIDDAALATAVYLCAGTQDLGTTEGQRSAVFSYNHSEQYVALVLAIMNAYLDGDFSEVPDGLPVSTFIPSKTDPSSAPRHHGTRSRHHGSRPGPNAPGTNGTPAAPHSPSNPGPGSSGSTDPNPSDPGPPGGSPSPGSPGTPGIPGTPGTPTAPNPTQTVQQVVLTVAEAKQKCVDKLSQFAPLTTGTMISGCTSVLTGLTDREADSKLVGSTLAQVLTSLGLGSLIPPLLPGT